MAHFAEVDSTGLVLRVVVVSNSDVLNEDGIEDEAVGKAFCVDLFGGEWIQTSYNARFRKHFAGPGFRYDSDADVFIAPQPFPSWILDENHDWQAPIPYPEDGGLYRWDEETESWIGPLPEPDPEA